MTSNNQKISGIDGSSATTEQEPKAKKAKTAAALQTNLFAFFASNVPTPPKKRKSKANDVDHDATATTETKKLPAADKASDVNDDMVAAAAAATADVGSSSVANTTCTVAAAAAAAAATLDATGTTTCTIPPPMIPTPTPTPRSITWQSLHDNFVMVRQPAPTGGSSMSFFSKPSTKNATTSLQQEQPLKRTKVAAIDLDGTLVVWRCAGFPSALSHYELWNSQVPSKLRELYDKEGYQIVLVSNQAAIQRAHTGKKAQLVQNVMNWIAALVDRPIYAVLSTQSSKKQGSFHKPNPELWKVAQKRLGGGDGNGDGGWDIASSFFVGDSADPEDPQGGVDAQFAKNVGGLYGTPLKFYTPTEFFGPSDHDRRQRQRQLTQSCPPPPSTVTQARSALLGGYWQGPILLILCGVQGSGKSTFCESILSSSKNEQHSSQTSWVHLSQDTIQNGKPGKREQVEDAARVALQKGQSVLVDRMHLTVEQRSHFVAIGVEESAPVHVVVLNPPRSVIAKRVRERTNHPGKVQGNDGVRRALQSMDQWVLPTYTTENDITLISCASTETAVSRLAHLYAKTPPPLQLPATSSATLFAEGSESVQLPTVCLGTMGIGKRIAIETIERAVSHGFRAIDTAPTYNNEDKVGEALASFKTDNEIVCVAKIPKSVVQPNQVRSALSKTLDQLQRSSVDLLLLHWPCDVMAAGTLVDVWKEMEACCRGGQCKALGVCNFNVVALSQLLAQASIPPVLNQVERHPLLAQLDLVDFCERHNIHLQAHTPLGQGNAQLLDNSVVNEVASETQTSPAAVVLQWNLQQGVSVVPKCRSEAHMQDVFQRKPLTPEQMKRLDALDCGKRFVAPPFMVGAAPYCWK